jgi:hypothetical protein
MKRGMIVEWRLWIVVALLVVAAIYAFGQWDQPVLLTNENNYHRYTKMIVDDSLRLHVFTVHPAAGACPPKARTRSADTCPITRL